VGSIRSRLARSLRKILETRLQRLLTANIGRDLHAHAECLDFVLSLVEDIADCKWRDRDFTMGTTFWPIRMAKKLLGELAVDTPTLAACNELEGTVTAATWMSNCWWSMRDPFGCSVPAELDPIAGPQILETGTRWAAVHARRRLTAV